MTTVIGPAPTITSRATHLALAAVRHIARRAEAARTGEDGDWRNNDVRRAFLRIADNITVSVLTPDPDRPGTRIIQTETPATHHGMLWAYIGQDALRRACPDGLVEPTGPYTYTLTITED